MAESIHTSRPLVWHRIGGRRRWRDVHGRTALPACGGWLTGPPPPCAIIANSLVLSGRYCQVFEVTTQCTRVVRQAPQDHGGSDGNKNSTGVCHRSDSGVGFGVAASAGGSSNGRCGCNHKITRKDLGGERRQSLRRCAGELLLREHSDEDVLPRSKSRWGKWCTPGSGFPKRHRRTGHGRLQPPRCEIGNPTVSGGLLQSGGPIGERRGNVASHAGSPWWTGDPRWLVHLNRHASDCQQDVASQITTFRIRIYILSFDKGVV